MNGAGFFPGTITVFEDNRVKFPMGRVSIYELNAIISSGRFYFEGLYALKDYDLRLTFNGEFYKRSMKDLCRSSMYFCVRLEDVDVADVKRKMKRFPGVIFAFGQDRQVNILFWLEQPPENNDHAAEVHEMLVGKVFDKLGYEANVSSTGKLTQGFEIYQDDAPIFKPNTRRLVL